MRNVDAYGVFLDALPREKSQSPLEICHARLRASMFPQQLALIEDRAHPIRSVCCSRRAGKTQGIMRGLLMRCLETPRSVCVYFVDTIARAKKLVWDGPDSIPTIIEDIGGSTVFKLNETDHLVTCINGSVLWVTGCETLPDAKKWKGLRYTLAVVDESQDWVEDILAYLIDQVLTPALMDTDGEVILSGVPGPILDGVFYKAAIGAYPGWSVHGWTYFDNPYIKNKDTFLAKYLKDRALSVEDPAIQREFFGKWVRDASSMLFHYLQVRNDFQQLPQAQEWRHVLGMDVGVRDLATYVLSSFRQYDPCVYVSEVKGEAATETTAPVSRMAEIIGDFRRVYGPTLGLVMDAGALGLGYQLELLNRFKLNVSAAKKTDKASAIRLMNDQFRLGNIKLGPGSEPLKQQYQRLQMDPKTQIEKPNQACDFADAALYSWRTCYAYLAQPAPDTTADGQRRAMVDRVLQDRIRAAQDGGDLARQRREMAQRSPYLND